MFPPIDRLLKKRIVIDFLDGMAWGYRHFGEMERVGAFKASLKLSITLPVTLPLILDHTMIINQTQA